MSGLNLPKDNSAFSRIYLDAYGKHIKDITIVVTHDCNLNCSYCYEHHKDKENKLTKETAKKIVDFLFEEDLKDSQLINKNEADALVLNFIGGEPFLEVETISFFMDYFREKAFQLNHRWFNKYMISISSNGINYFSPKVQTFIKNNLGRLSLGITVDGNKQLHDTCRLFHSGEGSYDYAAAAFKDVIKRTNNKSTKLTFAKENIKDTSNAIINMIEEFGCDNISANCAFEPLWNEYDANIFYYELKKIADYLINNNLYNDIYISLLNNEIGNYNNEYGNYCGGTGKMLAFDSNGEIYPCLRYLPLSIGNKQPKLLLGNLEEGLLNSDETKNTINMLNSITRDSQSEQKCLDCPIASGCAWCSAYNYEVFGTPNKRVTNICVMHQARVLAKNYYINKLCNILNCPDDKMEINIPEEWALKIITKDEFDLIRGL